MAGPAGGACRPPQDVLAEVDEVIGAARARIDAFDLELVLLFAPDHYNGFFYDLILFLGEKFLPKLKNYACRRIFPICRKLNPYLSASRLRDSPLALSSWICWLRNWRMK